MKIEFGPAELDLVKNHPLRLQDARGLLITCTSGIVWITVNGEADDIFLSTGEAHTLQRNGLALVESIEQGKVRIAVLPSAAPLTSLVRRLFRRHQALDPVPGNSQRARFA